MTRSERLFLENKAEVCGIIATIIKSIYGKDVYYMRTDFDCLCNGKVVEADLYLEKKTGRYLAIIN